MKQLLMACALLIVAGCASEKTATDIDQSQALLIRSALADQIRTCTETIGYHPDKVKVAENKIAPNELKWRQCAYDAIRAYAASYPTLRNMYDSLVAEDIAMTTAIQQGNLTRTARRQRIDRLLDQITVAELRQSSARSQNDRNVNSTRQVIGGLRGMR